MTIEELIEHLQTIKKTRGNNLFVYLDDGENYYELCPQALSVSESGQCFIIDTDPNCNAASFIHDTMQDGQ